MQIRFSEHIYVFVNKTPVPSCWPRAGERADHCCFVFHLWPVTAETCNLTTQKQKYPKYNRLSTDLSSWSQTATATLTEKKTSLYAMHLARRWVKLYRCQHNLFSQTAGPQSSFNCLIYSHILAAELWYNECPHSFKLSSSMSKESIRKIPPLESNKRQLWQQDYLMTYHITQRSIMFSSF